jgi:signal transduction histidine kinase
MGTPAARPAARAAFERRLDVAEVRLIERAIAVARAFLAATTMFIMQVGLMEPLRSRPLVDDLVLAYLIFATTVALPLLRAKTIPRELPLVVQIIDVGFAAILSLYIPGSNALLVTFLLYPALAAAYRWGFREVMVTALALDTLLFVEVLALAPFAASVSWLATGEYDLHAVVRRVILITASSATLGYLAGNEKRRRFEAETLASVLALARLGGRLADTMNLVLGALRSVFRARQVLIVLQEQSSGRAIMWASDPVADESIRPYPLPPARLPDYFFDAPGVAWHAAAPFLSRGRTFQLVALNEVGHQLSATELTLPAGFLASHPCSRLVGATLKLSTEWTGRLFVIQPQIGVHQERSARFALQLAEQAGPALYGHYLLRRLRTRAQAVERLRIARELHDGITQALLGLEMEVVVLRRRAMSDSPELAEELARVHGIVRNEVISVRELMEGLRVGDEEAGDLVQHLGSIVDRFTRHTGITARFISDGRTVSLTPHVRRQAMQIVHEALVNVRKHSGADHVFVRSVVDGRCWKLSIEDDGRGFQFAGRLSRAELEQVRQKPRTIDERVQLIGGDLVVESKPGFGATIEVIVPLQELPA